MNQHDFNGIETILWNQHDFYEINLQFYRIEIRLMETHGFSFDQLDFREIWSSFIAPGRVAWNPNDLIGIGRIFIESAGFSLNL